MNEWMNKWKKGRKITRHNCIVTLELFYTNPIYFCHGETELNRFYFINSPEKLTDLEENPKMLSFGQIKDVIRDLW